MEARPLARRRARPGSFRAPLMARHAPSNGMRASALLAATLAGALALTLPALVGVNPGALDHALSASAPGPSVGVYPLVAAVPFAFAVLASRRLPADLAGTLQARWHLRASLLALAGGALLGALVPLAPAAPSWLGLLLMAALAAASLAHFLAASASVLLGLVLHHRWRAALAADRVWEGTPAR